MVVKLTGKITEIGELKQITEKFSQVLVNIEVEEEYNGNSFYDHFPIGFNNTKVDLLGGFLVGDTVTVNCNLKGRKWEKNDKKGVFISLDGWKIEKVGGNAAPPASQTTDSGIAPKDDLPF